MNQKLLDDAVKYYSERYEVIAQHPFVATNKIRLQDYADDASRRCRFCRRGSPNVTFSSDAHAVPEFLGNRVILSMNECDECNAFLANHYEDHLSKWSLFARTTSQIRGKKGKPTFKNLDDTMRIQAGVKGMEITLTDPKLTSDLMAEGGPYKFTLPADASSQPHVPLRAAMALVKIACSICPPSEVAQCGSAIDWLMQRAKETINGLPILYAFTPGPLANEVSEVVLLRRKVDKAIPYLWLLVQFSNHRLQTFVPFCSADSTWLRGGEPIKFNCTHYPTKFGAEWKYGETEYGHLDWSGTEAVQRSVTATFHVENAVRVKSKREETRE